VHLDIRDTGAHRLSGARALFPQLAALNGKKSKAVKFGHSLVDPAQDM